MPEHPFDIITVTHPFRPITTYKVEPINKFFKIPAPDDVILRLRVLDKNFSFKELVTTGPTAIKEVKFLKKYSRKQFKNLLKAAYLWTPMNSVRALVFR